MNRYRSMPHATSLYLLMLLTLNALCGTSSKAGTLTNGVWKPDSCGEEPPAPVLHTESTSAYKESMEWVQLYQQRINTYNACLVKEANADVQAVNTAVRASQHRSNDAFKQYNDATKEMSNSSPDSSSPAQRGRNHGDRQGGFSIGSGEN